MNDRTPDPLRAVVETMDRLRSPGGCPWDAEQTHLSLLPYAVEEVYEVVEAVEEGDRAGLREELGDLLLQVLFHARIAAEHDADPFDVDDVAADLDAKLRRRHPHVFPSPSPCTGTDAGTEASTEAGPDAAVHATTTAEVEAGWDAIKAAEKRRDSALDGVPPGLPALALAQKLASRARRAGLIPPEGVPASPATEADLGARLLALVREADVSGLDAEGALRRAARDWERDLRAGERRPDVRPGEART